jgi:hypothetical protein
VIVDGALLAFLPTQEQGLGRVRAKFQAVKLKKSKLRFDMIEMMEMMEMICAPHELPKCASHSLA